MKRTAAILGHTPQFVRWAIEQPCPLREMDLEDLPKSSFQNLRSLRAIAEAQADRRIYDGFCLPPNIHEIAADSKEASDVMGFEIAEVFSFFGGETFVKDCCGNCLANARPANQASSLSPTSPLAGCYGWLPADPDWSPDSNLVATPLEQVELPENHSEPVLEAVEQALADSARKSDFESQFPDRPANWYGLWMQTHFQDRQLEILRAVMEAALSWLAARSKNTRELSHLIDAIKQCASHGLTLHTRLSPSGYSDGLRWKIFSHCGHCGVVRTAGDSCLSCGIVQRPVAARYQKVLGWRPFLKLKHIIGESSTQQLVSRFLNNK